MIRTSSVQPDLLFAWRSLRATPRLTLTAVACAALGLGAAIYMTALVRAVLFADPPIPDADRLVRIWSAQTLTSETGDVSYPEVQDLQARARSFDAVEAASRTRLAVTTDAGTERLRGESVTPGYFDLIGITPAVGRLFAPDEYSARADWPVIISHDLWQRRFGGRDDIVGQPFRTRPTARQSAGSIRTIVGVMPFGFVGTVDPDVSDFWVPIAHYEPAPLMRDRMVRSTWVLARLAPGVALTQARAEVSAIAAALALEHPQAYDRVTLTAEPFGESWRARFRVSLAALFAAAALLLLIACANVAALLLARLAQRDNELRVRTALGAPPGRLIRQLLFESSMIAAAGGVAGIAVALIALRLVAASGSFALPTYVRIEIDPLTVLAGLAMIAATGIVFGVLPAWLGARAHRTLLTQSNTTRVSLGRRQRRYGQALVAAQVAFTFMLLAGAILLVRTYQNLLGGDLGYRTPHLLRLALTPDPNVFSTNTARLALADDIRRTFAGHPGVARTSVMAGVLPPWFDDTVDIDLGADRQLRDVGRHAVDADYFAVMGMTLRRGRDFGPGDRATGATTALISESAADRIADATGRDAVGQRFRATMPGMNHVETFDIVGVVNDVQYHGPLRPRPADLDVYVPLERGGAGALSIAVHTSVDPASLIDPLSRELGRLAATSPQHWISTMEAELGLQYRDAKLYASLSGIYGVAAGLLAVLGIYSVLAHHVARRTREIGVRVAIGAQARDIVVMVLREGLATVAAGVATGLLLSLAATRWLSGLLYGVAPADSSTLVVVTAALVVAGAAAATIPASRAARVDPMRTLRDSV